MAYGFFDCDVPESIVEVPVPLHKKSKVFDDPNLVLIQNGDAVVVTYFPKGDKRSTVEVVEDMNVGCRSGEGIREMKAFNGGCRDGRTVRKLDSISVRGCLYI